LLKWMQLRLPHHHYCRADVAAGWLLLLHGAVAGPSVAKAVNRLLLLLLIAEAQGAINFC
jgi:hypothetical protein